MMKKRISKLGLALLIVGTILFSGCFKRDNLEDITIYTTTYPIEYIAKTIYGYNSNVLSIYPDGINVYDYKLTDKQIKDYSQSSIFIYNGLSDEKNIAKDFINQNTKIRIIDVSYGLKSTNYPESLWLSPSTYLMLATTVKNNLQEFITNKYINEEIENNYVPFQETLSLLDAELRSIGNAAMSKGTNILITNSDAFEYLTSYGFEIISLAKEENITENNLSDLRADFKSGTYKTIFMLDSIEKNELIEELIETHSLSVVTVKSMNTLNEDERTNKDTYITIMNEYIENIKNITLGE